MLVTAAATGASLLLGCAGPEPTARPADEPPAESSSASRSASQPASGLLILAGGTWDGATVVGDKNYLAEMLRLSQALNPSYGLLWWTNGQASSMSWAIPPVTTAGKLVRAAPNDLVAAQGARDRKLYVVPSLDLVVSRLGDNGSLEGSSFNDAFWEHLIDAAPAP